MWAEAEYARYVAAKITPKLPDHFGHMEQIVSPGTCVWVSLDHSSHRAHSFVQEDQDRVQPCGTDGFFSGDLAYTTDGVEWMEEQGVTGHGRSADWPIAEGPEGPNTVLTPASISVR